MGKLEFLGKTHQIKNGATYWSVKTKLRLDMWMKVRRDRTCFQQG